MLRFYNTLERARYFGKVDPVGDSAMKDWSFRENKYFSLRILQSDLWGSLGAYQSEHK
jgi:hypothetical protein